MLESKIAIFVNKAQTKNRALATLLMGEFDPQGYQSKKSRELLLKIGESYDFISLLSRESRGGLSDKEINNLIDFFTKWLDLSKVVVVNFTNYTTPINNQTVTVPADQYALRADLIAEEEQREDEIAAINAQIQEILGNIPDLADTFPEGFFDLYNADYKAVFNDDTRLHTHSNKAYLDEITAELLSALQSLSAHLANTTIHITSLERTSWNARITTGALTSALSAYALANHSHEIAAINGLTDLIAQLNDDIEAMAGADGKEVELQLNGDNLEWRYVGDDDWIDLGSVKGEQGEEGEGFDIDYRGDSSDRLNSLFDNEDENFCFLEEDTGFLYFRNPGGGNADTPAGWSTGTKFTGDNGWAPIFAAVNINSERTVLKLIDWVGGSGTKPVLDPGANPPTPLNWYLGTGGYTLDQSLAVNFKGPRGAGLGPVIGATGTLADRATYNSEVTGFIFLRTDVSPQVIYIKNSDTSGDWSAAYAWQGPPGSTLVTTVNLLGITTSGATVIFDFELAASKLFKALHEINGPRTWSYLNNSNALLIPAFTFDITAGAAQTLPANTIFVGSTQTLNEIVGYVWTPAYPGRYKASANFDNESWYWQIDGPLPVPV